MARLGSHHAMNLIRQLITEMSESLLSTTVVHFIGPKKYQLTSTVGI